MLSPEAYEKDIAAALARGDLEDVMQLLKGFAVVHPRRAEAVLEVLMAGLAYRQAVEEET